MKRFLALVLVMCMMLVPTISFADSSAFTLDGILNAHGIALTEYYGQELRTITRNPDSNTRAGTRIGNALILSTHEGDLYTETMLLVYDSDNNLINPMPATRASMTFKKYNISIALTTSYYKYKDPDGIMNYYRPYSVSGSWSSTDSTATVTRMEIEYSTSGVGYAYPECTTSNNPTKLGSKSYKIAKNVSNPTKGTKYSSSYAPSNYALQYAGIDAGSNLAIDIPSNKGSWPEGATALPGPSLHS